MKQIKRFFIYWLPVLLWATLIFYLSHIPYLRMVEGPWDFLLRKIAHMVEYAILARLLARALMHSFDTWTWKKVFVVTLTLCALYAVSDEYHQHFILGRVGSPRDVAIDTAGAWLALGILP